MRFTTVLLHQSTSVRWGHEYNLTIPVIHEVIDFVKKVEQAKQVQPLALARCQSSKQLQSKFLKVINKKEKKGNKLTHMNSSEKFCLFQLKLTIQVDDSI